MFRLGGLTLPTPGQAAARGDALPRLNESWSSWRSAGASKASALYAVAQPMDQAHIRNFSIIAHIDHGKSTLADRILELTHTVGRAGDARAAARLDGPRARARDHDQGPGGARVLHGADGETYQLHLIDTPGHVDFTYEVSRSLAACEGALLVVDASQGVEAQTVANTYLAVEVGAGADPVPEQDRPARRRARAGGRRSGRADRRADRGDPADQRQDGRRAWPRCSRS